jgi:hypothetical protein
MLGWAAPRPGQRSDAIAPRTTRRETVGTTKPAREPVGVINGVPDRIIFADAQL